MRLVKQAKLTLNLNEIFMNKKIPYLLLALIAFVFLPSLLEWLLDPEGLWYRPFIIWIIVVVITFIIQVRGSTDDV